MGPAKKAKRKRRSGNLNLEDSKLRRAEEMLRLAQIRVRRTTTTLAYWQAKVQMLRAQKVDLIQPSLFETTAPTLLDPPLTEPQRHETNPRMQDSSFGTELSPGGSPPPREGDDL